MEYKTAAVQGFEVEDEEHGIVTTLVSVTGVRDRVKDRIMPGAYARTLTKRQPKGVWHHKWDTPISKTIGAEELMPGDPRLPKVTPTGEPWPREAGAVQVKTQFNLETQRGREAFSDVRFFEDKQEWSIGYQVPPNGAKIDAKSGERIITDLDWFEYSPVLFGAMPLATTAGVKDAQELWMEVKDGNIDLDALYEKAAAMDAKSDDDEDDDEDMEEVVIPDDAADEDDEDDDMPEEKGGRMKRRRKRRRMMEEDMETPENEGDTMEKSMDDLLADAIGSLEDLMAAVQVKAAPVTDEPDFFAVLADVAEGDEEVQSKGYDISTVLEAEVPDLNHLESKANAFLDLVEERLATGEHDGYVELASSLSGLIQKTMQERGDEMVAVVEDVFYDEDADDLPDDVDGDNASAWKSLDDPDDESDDTDDVALKDIISQEDLDALRSVLDN